MQNRKGFGVFRVRGRVLEGFWEASGGLARGLGRRCSLPLKKLEGQFTKARQWGKSKLQNRKGFGVFRVRGRVLEGFWRASEGLLARGMGRVAPPKAWAARQRSLARRERRC